VIFSSRGIASARRRCLCGLCYRTGYLAPLGCKHLANAAKTDHIRQVNAKLGYETPKLITPLELLGVEP